MSVGTPVVVSDIPVFREVGGDAAAYAAPDDVDGFVAAVRELDDPAVHAARSAAARDRAGHYTWAASARTLLTLLESLA
jgi:glycosyltransferase involved in cell wall biosynthesis